MELSKFAAYLLLLLVELTVINQVAVASQDGESSSTEFPSSSSTEFHLPDTTFDASNEVTPSKSNQHISDEELNKLAKILKVNQKKLPGLKKLGRKINSLIDRVNAADGHLRPELFVQEFIPDPLPMKDIDVESEESFFTHYTGKFTKVMLHGISGVKIHSIKANVGKFTAKVSGDN